MQSHNPLLYLLKSEHQRGTQELKKKLPKEAVEAETAHHKCMYCEVKLNEYAPLWQRIHVHFSHSLAEINMCQFLGDAHIFSFPPPCFSCDVFTLSIPESISFKHHLPVLPCHQCFAHILCVYLCIYIYVYTCHLRTAWLLAHVKMLFEAFLMDRWDVSVHSIFCYWPVALGQRLVDRGWWGIARVYIAFAEQVY